MSRSSSPNGESAHTLRETPYEPRAPQDDTISQNLADQPDIPVKTESPLYSPLQGSDIRLFSVQRARPDGVLRCNLFHAPLTKDLKFHALSYVWGDLDHKQTIMINDQPVEVNQNLYDFLDQIWKMADLSTRGEEILVEPSVDDLFRRECLSIYGEEISVAPFTEALHWWIDAICINQENIDEKNEQIPHMGQLYSSASQVWVWLGLPRTMSFKDPDFVALKLALSSQFAKQLSDKKEQDEKSTLLASQLGKAALDILARILARLILKRMQEDFRTNGSQYLTDPVMPGPQVIAEALKAGVSENRIREGAGFSRVSGEEYTLLISPGDLETFPGRLIMELGLLMKNPWFERTWVIQEFVLSRSPPIALIGGYPFHFFRLFDLSRFIFHNSSTLSNKTHAAYRFIENDLHKLFGLMNAYQWRRGSGMSFETHGFSLLSPAHKLLCLLKLFFEKQSTDPHDHIYGMLGLLGDQLPKRLKPNYKLPFEKVCQAYAKFILEATKNLKIIEAHKSELKACPSWVPDFRYLVAMHESHTTSTTGAVRFSADSQQLTVEGIPIGRVLSCSCNHPKAAVTIVDRLRMINDDILTGSARLTERPLEIIFTIWFKTMLVPNFKLPLESVSDIQNMESLISDFTTALVKLETHSAIRPPPRIKLDDYVASMYIYQMVIFLISSEYCLLETGDIAICQLKRPELQIRHHEGDAVWALKGCENLSILRPEEGAYTYEGLCQVLQPGLKNLPLAVQFGMLHIGMVFSFQLNEEFFAGNQLEELTLV
jgi:hypothetical protein